MARRLVAGLMGLGLLVGLAGSVRADTDLELLGGRFRVTAVWQTADASGPAQAVRLTDETGLFWFFSAGNTELVVKILNACTPYDRFWIYAAGLTNVGVELFVEDTWTGETKSYLRQGGSLFAPLADTTTFRNCGVTGPACGQGTREEIAATPRPDGEAEALALLLGPGVTADPAIYARLHDDLARIRTLFPSLANVGFLLIWDPSSLLVELTPSAYQKLQAGNFDEWDCLNHWYGGEVTHIYGSGDALIHFEGFFHPARIGTDYEALPGISRVFPNHIGYPAGGPLDSLCAKKVEGTAYDYFFDDQTHGQVWYFRVPQAGAAPVTIGQVGHQGPRPDWWPLFEQCREDLAAASQD